jgi:hypothetical protein
MPKTAQERESYLRDLENLRRLKEGLAKDKAIDAGLRADILTMLETVHLCIGISDSPDGARAFIANMIARLQKRAEAAK